MPRSLEQWLAFQSQAHPTAIDLGLARIRRVLAALAWVQPEVPVITVAGTNGKGSVSAFCTAILGAAGYRVGTFTSPHLRDYRERIRVHDRWVAKDELVWAFERIEAACSAAASAAAPVSLTFFEYNALAAFLIFEAARLDAWVLEVGMGGRLDAVNVIEPSVSVVVSIGLDHQEYLGATLDAIAREKAGIFRPGRPAIIGSREPPPALIDRAVELGARALRLGRDFEVERTHGCWNFRGVAWQLSCLPPPALVGDIQFENAATAVAALEQLASRLPAAAAAVAAGMRSAHLPGRFQVIDPGANRPLWILDVAHNPAAAQVLRDNLRAAPVSGRSLAVCGILADKDAAAIAAILQECFAAWFLAATEGPRGSSAAALASRIAAHVAAPLQPADGVAAACAAAWKAALPGDRIVVFGSFHTVGPALDWLDSQLLLPPASLPEYTDPPRMP